MEIKISVKDKEIGCEDNFIGDIDINYILNGEATGYDVVNTMVKVMEIIGYHPETIKKALEEALEDRKSKND